MASKLTLKKLIKEIQKQVKKILKKKKINNNVYLIQKEEGLTPLEALNKLKDTKPHLKEEKLTYAGRLDPLASGVMIVLSGDERFKKEEYLNLDKTYEVEILFGVSTDTGDVLGLVEEASDKDVQLDLIKQKTKNLLGTSIETAPFYSSPGLDGKNFKKEVNIKSIKYLESKKESGRELLGQIENRIKKVSGDFRQDKIIKSWHENLGKDHNFLLVKFLISSSRGAYMRLLAERLGQEVEVPALAYSIVRTRVGEWSKEDSIFL